MLILAPVMHRKGSDGAARSQEPKHLGIAAFHAGNPTIAAPANALRHEAGAYPQACPLNLLIASSGQRTASLTALTRANFSIKRCENQRATHHCTFVVLG